MRPLFFAVAIFWAPAGACTGVADPPAPPVETDGGQPENDVAAPPDVAPITPDVAQVPPDVAPISPDAPPPAPDVAPPRPDLVPDRPPPPSPAADAGPPPSLPRFSFFVTSIEMMRELSGSPNGFGGNLGGLAGADSICQKIAARVGAGQKTWRAFLSATRGPDGGPVHAIDRIGEGPWYDRNGRLIAMNKQGLLGERPMADPQAREDLPNERGEGQKRFGDNHDILTGSNRMGRAVSGDPATTCQDWTSAVGPGTGGKVYCGHSWPRSTSSGRHWISEHTVRGCAPGVNLTSNGAGTGDCVGCGGGYGGLYCFALTP